MKKKLLIGMLALPLAFSMNVKADNATIGTLDTSGVNVEWYETNTKVNQHNKLKTTGLKSDTDAIDYTYYIFFKNDSTAPKITLSSSGYSIDFNNTDKYGSYFEKATNDSGETFSYFHIPTDLQTFYENNLDLYYTILEEAASKTNSTAPTFKISTPKKLNRLAYKNLSERIYVHSINAVPNDYHVWFNDTIYAKERLNFKIGKITDSNLIKNANSSQSYYTQLLAYAKSDSNGHTGVIEGANNTPNNNVIYDAMSGYDENSYYYVYFWFDDYDLEDIDYYSWDNTLIDKPHLEYHRNINVGETEEYTVETTPTAKPKNPKTGVEDLVYLVPVVLFGGLGVVALTRKKTSFR